MSCKEPGRGTIPSVFKQFLFYGLLGLVLVALLPGTAKAEPEWCVRELSRSDESVVVQHNPECDLRILTRMYPQKDDDGKVLPEQVQLRSLFAANQTRVVDGVTYRYTVMRACVKPGKPSKDADEEELKLCPKGLENYFSAPASDSAARIVIPAKRQLTIAEQNLALAKTACTQLQDKPLVTDADKKAATSCSKQFTAMVFGAKVKTSPADSDNAGAKEPNKIKEPEVAKAVPGNSTIDSKNADDKSQFVIPLFIMLIGLAIYGAAVTMFYIKVNRDKNALLKSHAILIAERNEVKAIMQGEVAEELKLRLRAQRERIVKEQRDAWNNTLNRQQRELNQITDDNAKLKERNEELGKQIEDYRESVLPVNGFASPKLVSTDVDQLKIIDEQATEIRSLKNETAGQAQQIAELRGEMDALAERNTVLEDEAAQSHNEARAAKRDKVALEVRVSELEEEVSSLKAGNLKLQDTIQEKDQQIAVHEKAALSHTEEKRALEVRVRQLLEAAGMCGMSTGTGRCRSVLKDTLPLGVTADQLANYAKDEISGSMAADIPEPVRLMESEAQGGGHPENWQDVTAVDSEDDVRRRAEDSIKPQPIEGVVFRNNDALEPLRSPLDLDPDEAVPYREEMSTLEHVPVTKIVQEQMIHYRDAWLHLARACAAVVDSDLKVDAFSNVESVNAGLTKNLFEFSSESFSASAKLEALKKEHGVVSIQLEQIAAKLRSKTTELDIATHVVSDLREKMDGFARDVKGNRAMEKIYAYQLATVQADTRAITAEIALRDTKEELQQAQTALSSGEAAITELKKENGLLQEANKLLEVKSLNSANESAATWRREYGTGSGLAVDPNKASDLSKALMLRQKDLVPARDVLVQLPDEELLRLASSIFHAIALKVGSGAQLEFPLASDADLGALRHVVMMPLVSDFPYRLPAKLMSMAGQGASPRMYSVVHDAFAELQVEVRSPIRQETILPPAGVPGDRNSAPPSEANHSQIQQRAVICPPADAKDDKSHTA